MISRMTMDSYKLKVHNNLLRAAKARVGRINSSEATAVARNSLQLHKTT